MGTTLDHGIYLPDEGERNCYDGLAGNWVALDNHLGSTDIHVTINDKQAWDGHIADTTIHVTSADKQAWNGHVADTTIHVTSADKQAWDGHIADSVKHVTAEDKAKWDAVTSKADDSDVVHKSGNEDVNGIKTFKDMIPIDGDYLGNEASTNQRTNICLRSNRDTADKSGAYITRFRQNRSQGALQTSDLQMIGFDVLENEVRTNNVLSIQCTNWLNDVPQKVNIISSVLPYSYGNRARKALFNDLNPGALSLPDLNNGIDISSYLTNIGTTTPSEYTPLVNGWIVLKISAPSGSVVIRVSSDNGIDSYSYSERSDVGGLIADVGYTYEKFASCTVPCIKNDKLNIYIMPTKTSIVSAKFFPCQGNV